MDGPNELRILMVLDDPADIEAGMALFPDATIRDSEAILGESPLELGQVALVRDRENVEKVLGHLRADRLAVVLVHDGKRDDDELGDLAVDASYQGSIDDNLRTMVELAARARAIAHERDRLSRELRHGIRLEAMGRIAGGVAHDFNNLLTTVGCFAGFIEDSGSDDAIEDAREILRASERGTELTRRLVALSRERETRLEPLDVSKVVDDIQRLLAKSAGAGVRLSFDLRSGLSPVHFDRSDLEQAVLHVVLQARDGFNHGGQILIQTWQRGRHVGVEIQDDGPGLPESVRREIYDDIGDVERRRLGLRAVREIVEQGGGVLEVEAKAGAGTTYRLIFDALSRLPDIAGTEVSVVHIDGAKRRVVLLDLDESVVRAARKQLKRLEFVVDSAKDYADLFASLREERFGEVSFLIVDEAAVDAEKREALRRGFPGIARVMTTGDSATSESPHWAVLRKPFRAEGLVTALNAAEELVDRSSRARPARVLIVDDDALTARSIERVLAGLCEPEHVFGDRNTLLSRLEADDYDLVLCDVLMPGINGMQLFEWVRSRYPAIASRFVFLTAAAEFDVIRTFAESIPNPVYAKPMDRDGFEQLLSERGLL